MARRFLFMVWEYLGALVSKEKISFYQKSYLTLLVTASLVNLHKSISSPLSFQYNLKLPLTRSTRS